MNRIDGSGLYRWEFCGPDLARLLVTEFERSACVGESNDEPNVQRHHEDNTKFQEAFFNDVQKVISAMECNPFQMEKITAINNTNVTFNDVVYEHISKLEKAGDEQCHDYRKTNDASGFTY